MLAYIILFLSLGFIGLFLGGKLVIDGLENIANELGLSHLMVGLTILAIGTSLPEIAVSVIGGIDKLYGIEPDVDGIVIGNKVGSFIVNITLILGILGLAQSVSVSKWVLKREGPMLFISLFVFFLFALDLVLTRLEALIMISMYFIYLFLIIKSEKKIEKTTVKTEEYYEKEEIDQIFLEPVEKIFPTKSVKIDILIFLIGLVILLVAGEVTILASVELAHTLNIPTAVVGLLIVSVGTSLPELSADLIAVRRKSEGIAVGGILGSNICNLLLATGLGVVIVDFNVPLSILLFDIPMCLVAIIIVYYFLWTEKNLKKWEAFLLVSFYGFYVILRILLLY
ncbi:MAG: calcium/sodium antiporter, partial [Candidatus Lokiarchaeota archaeon]|nr:calcium/sodium antiporter [Candidatus Lokiarchaeota archaeon]MBD3340201.1 calcium/sodium antiporter [Candidatus Lokiarchaeota archaeon]